MVQLEKPSVAEQAKKNVWASIWIAPRATIRAAIEGNMMRLAFILIAISGVIRFLDQAIAKNLGDTVPFLLILVLALIAGPLLGLLGWVIGASLITWVGKWFGGLGTYREMKIALGLSNIPMAFALAAYCLDVVVLRQALFMDVEISIVQALWLLLSASITAVLGGWSAFMGIKAVAEVHRFSSWLALLTLLILAFILVVIIFVIVFILIFFAFI